MTKYYLANGDEIKVGEVYKTRDGRKAFVSWIGNNPDGLIGIYGITEKSCINRGWLIDGKCYQYVNGKEIETPLDLISLWKDEPVINCDQLGKVEVSDELALVFLKEWHKDTCDYDDMYKNNIKRCLEAVFAHLQRVFIDSQILASKPSGFSQNQQERIAENLVRQSVFNHTGDNKEKPNNSIFDSFPPELPILDEEKQGEWRRHLGNGKPNDVCDKTLLEVKIVFNDIISQETLRGENIYWAWWDWQQYNSRIIAYRIIPEQTDLTKTIQQVDDITEQLLEMNEAIEQATKDCENIRKIMDEKDRIIAELRAEIVRLEEPKKQTFLEFMDEYYYSFSSDSKFLIDKISEYLEQNK